MAEKNTGGAGIGYLETRYFESVIQAFSKGTAEYDDIRSAVGDTIDKLLPTWEGDGKKQFEYDYDILYRQLEDIGDILYELYDALVEAEAAYIEADTLASKQISISGGE